MHNTQIIIASQQLHKRDYKNYHELVYQRYRKRNFVSALHKIDSALNCEKHSPKVSSLMAHFMVCNLHFHDEELMGEEEGREKAN